MPSYDPTLFNVSPYYDDFDEDKNFHRLLFKPGYAVQARELTQIQTVLQNQIERFGNHIFKEGSRVFGSEIVSNDISFVRMIPYVGTSTGNTQGINLDNWIGNIIHQGTSGVPSEDTKAKIVHAEKSHSDNDNYSVFFVDYLQGSPFNSGSTVYLESSAGGTAWVAGASGDVISAPIGGTGSTAAEDAVNVDGITGQAKLVSVTPGIYYVNGSFVKNSSQTLSPFALTGDNSDIRQFPKPSNKIGFDIKQTVVTSHDDFSLRDPSAGSYNYNAPGADRYKIELDLVHTQAGVVDGIDVKYKNLIELLRFREGKITYKNVYTQYNELEKTLARRTYDESGNYTVRPFNITLREHLDDGTNNGVYKLGKTSDAGLGATSGYLACALEPGKAYIFGHEFETQATEFVDIRKARGEDHIKTLDLYTPNSADCGIWIYATAHEDFGIMFDEIASGARNIHNHWSITGNMWAGSSGPSSDGTDYFADVDDKGVGIASAYVGRCHIARIEHARYTEDTVTDYPNLDTQYYRGDGVLDDDGNKIYKILLNGLGRRRPGLDVNGNTVHKSIQQATRITRFTSHSAWSPRGTVAEGGIGWDDTAIVGFIPNSNGTTPNADHLILKVLNGKTEWGALRNNRVSQWQTNNYGLVFWNDKGSACSNVSKLRYEFTWSWDINKTDNGSYFQEGDAGSNGHLIFKLPEAWPNDAASKLTFVNTLANNNHDLDDREKLRYMLLEKSNYDDASDIEKPPAVVNLDDWTIKMSEGARTLTLLPPDGQEIDINSSYTFNGDIYVFDDDVNANTVATKTLESRSGDTPLVRKMVLGDGTAQDPYTVSGWVRMYRDSILIYLADSDIHNCSKIIMNDKGVTTDVTNDFVMYNGSNRNGVWHGRVYAKSATDMSRMNLNGDGNELTPYINGVDGATFPNLEFHYDYFKRSNPAGQYRPVPSVVNSYTMGDVPLDLVPMEQIRGSRRTLPASLTSVVDFRYCNKNHVANASTHKETGTNIISNTLRVAHDYYLPRVDKVILTNQLGSQNSTFQVIEGRPADVPLPPTDRSDSLTLYSLIVTPYTFNSSDVIVNQINHQRYTMKDIGRLDKKITDVEHYASLSLLEKEMMAKQMFKDSEAEPQTYEMFKAGIFVDQFRGHNVGDVSKFDYTCSIDKENNILRPPFEFRNYNFALSSLGGNLVQTPDDLVMIKSTGTEKFIDQSLASTSISINPFNLVNWLGNLTINPPSSRRMDMNKRPVVKTFSDGLNDNWRANNWGGKGGYRSFVDRVMKGFGSQWNDWESIWCGVDLGDNEFYSERGKLLINRASTKIFEEQVDDVWWKRTGPQAPRTTKTIDQIKSESGMKSRQNPEQLTHEIGNRIVDKSIVPYLEEQILTIKANALKPNTYVNCFFDDRNVNSNCSIGSGDDKVYGPFKTGTGGDLIDWSAGTTADITFTLPPNVFLSGEKLFRLTDNEDNEVAQSSTAAEAIYYAVGIQPLNSEIGINSTRPSVVQRQSITSNKIVRDVSTRTQTMDTSVNTQWVDPIAQSFTVDVNDYKDGLFLESVDLYFSKKDDYDPVVVELRPLLNGRPHGSHSIPFSRVVKNQADIKTNINSPGDATTFNFSSPVYLPPGDYALVVKSNSVDSQLWAAEIGGTDISSGLMIDRQPYSGVLFQPQNSSVAEINQGLDLMFTLNKSVFENSAGGGNPTTASFSVVNTFDDELIAHTIRLNSNQLLPHATKLLHKISWSNVDSDNPIHTNENIEVNSYGYDSSSNIVYRKIGGSENIITTSFEGTQHVSPVVDLKNLDLFGIRNVVNNVSRTETSRYAWGWTTEKAAARYISRRVDLSEGILAGHLRVLLDINQQEDRTSSQFLLNMPNFSNTSSLGIRVFAKWLENDSNAEDTESNENVADSVLITEDETQKDFDFLRYYELFPVSNPFQNGASESDFDFREVEFRLPWYLEDTNRDLIGTFAIKIVMYADDSSKPPKVKNLRAVALA